MALIKVKDVKISIHALREEGDSKNREKTPCFCLIIHLSAQIAKRCLQNKPQNHTVTCANGWYSGAKRPGKPCVLPVRTGRTSKDQHAVLGKFWVQSNVLDLRLVVVAQLVEPQTVQGGVDQGGQLCFENCVLRSVQQAFEHGILHPLPMIYALLGNLAQPFASGRGLGVYVVGDQY